MPDLPGDGTRRARYLRWFEHEAEHRADALALSLDGLCPVHVNDLIREPVRELVLEVQTGARRAELAKRPERGSSRRGQRWRRTPRTAEAHEAVRGARVCPACRSADAVERGTTALLLVALGDPRVAEPFRRGHGLCLRHALASEHPLVREVTGVRIETVAWELEEHFRKTTWDFRHETHGPEANAWQRAPALLDGATYLGAAAAPLP